MKNPLQSRSLSTTALAIVFSLSVLASACDSGGESTNNETAKTGEANDAAAGESSRTGTITIGGDTWTVVPATQCSVYSGNVVMIAGHAAENEEIEIVIDHDPSSELVSAYVQGPDNSPYWIAQDDAITFEIDGKTVKGGGTFSVGLGGQVEDGQPRQVEGAFEVNC